MIDSSLPSSSNLLIMTMMLTMSVDRAQILQNALLSMHTCVMMQLARAGSVSSPLRCGMFVLDYDRYALHFAVELLQ